MPLWPEHQSNILSIIDKNMFLCTNNLAQISKQFDMAMPSLVCLYNLTSVYDGIIDLQKDALSSLTRIKPFQKKYLIRHETVQKEKILLGQEDLENTTIISSAVTSTVKLVNSISGIQNDNLDRDDFTKDVEIELHSRLEKQGYGYLEALSGARESAKGNNPDKIRHTITSLRELSTHVLHNLSPDEKIKIWNTNPENYVNGKPTRRCRLEYILKNSAGSRICPFIENEVKFIKDFFDIFNIGTHSMTCDFKEEDLFYLINKTESILLLLMKYSSREL